MLPALLSEQLCSLRSGTERFAVSVIWTLQELPPAPETQGPLASATAGSGKPSYRVLDVWFGRTLIRSRHQLHYHQASKQAGGQGPQGCCAAGAAGVGVGVVAWHAPWWRVVH